jgi:P27 family predicted phage terminase small subunit
MRQRGRKSAASLAVIGSKPRLIASNPAASSSNPPQPPKHLGEVERAIWANVVAEYQGTLTSYSVLTSGLEAHQRAREARLQIEEEGLTIVGRDGQSKAHPLLTVERDARKAFQQTFRYLGVKL